VRNRALILLAFRHRFSSRAAAEGKYWGREHLLNVAIRKVPNLVLNEIAGELHEFRFTR
jgi:hypothetical protein